MFLILHFSPNSERPQTKQKWERGKCNGKHQAAAALAGSASSTACSTMPMGMSKVMLAATLCEKWCKKNVKQ